MSASPFAAAATTPAFSNGTEGSAWMDRWCSYCARDHGAHNGTYDGCCDLITGAMFPDADWPEAWLPEPDDGSFSLPSRMVCLAFTPCEQGDCDGDPGAEPRAERIQEVAVYWRRRSSSGEPQPADGGER